MCNIVYLSLKEGTPASGYWDQTFLADLLEDMPDSDRTVVIIPGAYQGDIIDKINDELAKYPKVLVFITSDEEGKFDCSKLKHPDIIHYCQYGYCDHFFPIGYTKNTREMLKHIGQVKKDLSIFFAGQLNSDERREAFSRMALTPKAVLFGTEGFSKGLSPDQYYGYMARAVFAPAPGGHVSPDSFRFYEGLEAGCFPSDFPQYMFSLFPDMPFKGNNFTMFAWWIKTKILIKQRLRKDLGIQEAMTIIVPTSPIKSHPSTEIIDQTIESIRHHTDMDIIITIDGVRPEQKDLEPQYQEYVRKLLWKCNFEYKNVIPLLFEKHMHQSGMIKEALEYVKTPLVMFVEHDTPLVTDMEIDWKAISKDILGGVANVIRFHFEAKIPEEHEYLMVHEKDMPNLVATKQWSQRPHVAGTAFYKDIMQFFSPDANCFIEDLIYGKCVEGNWDDWKVFIYHPAGNIKRSLNLDGRAGDKKFEKEQVW